MATYQLTQDAEHDLESIFEYTLQNFGEKQLRRYTAQLKACMDQITRLNGRYRVLEIQQHTVRSLHCRKHYLFAWVTHQQSVIILAVLHERMDFMQYLHKRLTL